MAEEEQGLQQSQQGLLAERTAALQQITLAMPQGGSEEWSANIVDAKLDLLTGKQANKYQKYAKIW